MGLQNDPRKKVMGKNKRLNKMIHLHYYPKDFIEDKHIRSYQDC